MEKKTTVGPKGQVVIPKEIREKIGIKEYSEVIVDVVDDSVIIRKIKPESVSYVDFYSATYSRKLKKKTDIKKIAEEQYEGNILHRL
ncbi:MAG: AbrB/MazE/SpoVT family DNA-binding domain-containing protein [Thermoplasmataceae archaeon]